MRRLGVDVMHTHQSAANCFGVLLKWVSGVPSVATAHARSFQLHWMWNDHVIGVSESTTRYQRMVNRVPASRSTTVHNFVDVELFSRRRDEARARLRREWGVDDKAVVIGAVGDVIPRKGMLHLVRALPEVFRRSPAARMVCVGGPGPGPDYLRRVREEAETLEVADRIVFTGTRRDVPELLSAMDLFVMPSLEECFPLSLLEAMATGLPCVATRVGGIPECVADWRTGVLVAPGQSSPLAEALVGLARDAGLRRAMGLAGRDRVAACFSPAGQAAKVSRILASVTLAGGVTEGTRSPRWAA
jgi:glycosyltransferase involved in cell wall biosynthesis